MEKVQTAQPENKFPTEISDW